MALVEVDVEEAATVVVVARYSRVLEKPASFRKCPPVANHFKPSSQNLADEVHWRWSYESIVFNISSIVVIITIVIFHITLARWRCLELTTSCLPVSTVFFFAAVSGLLGDLVLQLYLEI